MSCGREWIDATRRIVRSLVFYVTVYVLWSLWRRWGGALLPPGAGSALLEAVAVKNMIWLAPFLPVLRDRREDGWLILPWQLFATPFPKLACLTLLCVSAVFLHTVRIASGSLNTIVLFDPVFVILSLCAGMTEEFMFRGILFNRQAAVLGVARAAALNGLLFALIHYPGLVWGQEWRELVSFRTLLIFVMGVLFCLALARWKNLALTMTVHTVWNILSYWLGLSG